MAYSSNRILDAGLRSRTSEFIEQVRDYLRRRSVYVQTLRELNALTDRELMDLGIARASIADVAREAAFGN
jgi:uncharacterized protein YjiS (DUF1127 family)